MPAVFSKNCVLSGELDLYCLACCIYLKSDEDALTHIQGKKHKQLITSLGYLEKYERDFIRKVNGVYFCESCNITLSTVAKVKIHVTEDAHLAGKRRRTLNRVGNGGVFAGDVFISENAWHALVEDTCVLCNVEGVDVTAHKSEKSHVINLINNKVFIGDNNVIYRKIEDIYQCLTCNKIISEQLLTEHLGSEEHKASIKYVKNQNHKINSSTKDNSSKDEMNTNIKGKTDKGYLLNKPETNVIKPRGMEEHQRIISSAYLPKTVESLARQHGLIVKDVNNLYCDVCSTKVVATIDSIIEHVAVHKHTENKTKRTNSKRETPIAMEKVTIKEYLFSVQFIHTFSNKMYSVLNDSLCIQLHNFAGISAYQNKIICTFCHIDLLPQNTPLHIQSAIHRELLENSSVVTSLKNEFVRQVKSDIFHCGYCGVIESDFDDMLDHLDSDEHKKCKTDLQNKLIEFKRQTERQPYHNVDVLADFDFLTLRYRYEELFNGMLL